MARIFTLAFISLFFLSQDAYSCCAEKVYNLYPLGELEGKIVLAEFDLHRNCKQGTGAGETNEFWIMGNVELVTWEGDSLKTLESIGKIDAKECICTYENHFENSDFEGIVSEFYGMALSKARRHANFVEVNHTSVFFNDTINTTIIEIANDSMYYHGMEYGGIFELDYEDIGIISQFPSKVTEVRKYETSKNVITIIRIRSSLQKEDEVLRNRNKFKNIEESFWKEQAQWHGIARDFLLVEQK